MQSAITFPKEKEGSPSLGWNLHLWGYKILWGGQPVVTFVLLPLFAAYNRVARSPSLNSPHWQNCWIFCPSAPQRLLRSPLLILKSRSSGKCKARSRCHLFPDIKTRRESAGWATSVTRGRRSACDNRVIFHGTSSKMEIGWHWKLWSLHLIRWSSGDL